MFSRSVETVWNWNNSDTVHDNILETVAKRALPIIFDVNAIKLTVCWYLNSGQYRQIVLSVRLELYASDFTLIFFFIIFYVYYLILIA